MANAPIEVSHTSNLLEKYGLKPWPLTSSGTIPTGEKSGSDPAGYSNSDDVVSSDKRQANRRLSESGFPDSWPHQISKPTTQKNAVTLYDTYTNNITLTPSQHRHRHQTHDGHITKRQHPSAPLSPERMASETDCTPACTQHTRAGNPAANRSGSVFRVDGGITQVPLASNENGARFAAYRRLRAVRLPAPAWNAARERGNIYSSRAINFGEGKREIPEKTRQTSGIVRHDSPLGKNPGVTRPGIKRGSPSVGSGVATMYSSHAATVWRRWSMHVGRLDRDTVNRLNGARSRKWSTSSERRCHDQQLGPVTTLTTNYGFKCTNGALFGVPARRERPDGKSYNVEHSQTGLSIVEIWSAHLVGYNVLPILRELVLQVLELVFNASLREKCICIIAGPSGCGKTCVLLSLLEEENGLRFNTVYIYSKSLQQQKYYATGTSTANCGWRGLFPMQRYRSCHTSERSTAKLDSVYAEGTLARCSCEVEKLQNKRSSALNTDKHTTPATQKSKLDMEDAAGSVADHKDSIDDDYDDSDRVEDDDYSLDGPTRFPNEYPSTSDCGDLRKKTGLSQWLEKVNLKKLSAPDKRNVIRKVKQNAPTLAAQLCEETGKQVHPESIQRVLRKEEHNGRNLWDKLDDKVRTIPIRSNEDFKKVLQTAWFDISSQYNQDAGCKHTKTLMIDILLQTEVRRRGRSRRRKLGWSARPRCAADAFRGPAYDYLSASTNTINDGDRCCVSLLASHQGELGSSPGRVTSGFPHGGIVPDVAAGRRVFSGISRVSPAPSIRRCSMLVSITLIGSQDLAVKARLHHT
ncbi:hypothetical protein PR048_025338 [Dryococelus australis]|uniref:Uncharacterized protein n=1 Tax=Dryococelus australis TaxID=614101 RepID=A0ABQ9GR51_9NEOP|nr:hypothetical protein PR048_025338 [Dryococelus australis]